MNAPLRVGRLTRGVGLLLVAIGIALVAVLLVRSSEPRRPTRSPGSDLFELLPDLIEFVEYESPGMKVTIARGPTAGSFVVSKSANGGVERCVGGEAVSAVLRAVSHLRVVRDASLPAGRSGQAALDHLEIRLSGANSEPDEWDIDPRLDDPLPVLVSNGKYAWEVDLSKGALRMLRGGCQSLGGARK
jgi:hypothetical protein